jgi:hypothetical protein
MRRAALPAALLAAVAFAQEANQGSITGSVRDQSDAVIPSASVTATSRATGQSRSLATGADG